MSSYDCAKCPGFCCSYPIIAINKKDVERLGRHFGLDFETAKKKFTVPREKEKYTLRRKADEHFGRICRFFDTEKRRCGVYEARPSTCRNYPTQKSCGYFDFLKFERDQQDDKDWVARTDNR